MNPTAIVADDEEYLRAHLVQKLSKLWPELNVISEAANGLEAVAAIGLHRPSVAFLDIKMPGLTGLQVAQQLEGQTRFVFVTAYDQFALEAFEREAVDFLVKPIDDERLSRTIRRLRNQLEQPALTPMADLAGVLRQLGIPPTTSTTPARLRWLRASRGETTTHIPVQDIHYIQSDDKYTIVYTETAEHVVRMPISELVAGLDAEQFWQIHRSTIVNMNFVSGTRRDDAARLFVKLRGRKNELTVSRAWMHLFR